MLREGRARLLLRPALEHVWALVDRLRALPWPEAVQRVSRRGAERLATLLPELRDLLTRRGSVRHDEPVGGEAQELPALLAGLSARTYDLRAAAVRGLARHRTPEVVAALAGALRDRSVEVAVAAATSLAMVADAQAEAALGDVFRNLEGYYHPLTRAAAVRGLGALGADEILRHALRDLDAEVSIAAIDALAGRTSIESASALLGVVENADGFYLPITRLAAVRALERLPPPPAPELEALRARESDPLVAEALTKLLERASGLPLYA